jgi:hypothetical protein
MGKTSNSNGNGNGGRAGGAIFPITIAITITGLKGSRDKHEYYQSYIP